ncbi:hypothetical protein IPM44_04270 [bacterium]|nr:MAG: hypothetical protein IPM44_04270 [bacterium]
MARLKRLRIQLVKINSKLSTFIKKYPAIVIPLVWIISMVILRFFVVSVIHQPGNTTYNPPIITGLIGAIKWDGVSYLAIIQKGYDLSSFNTVFYPVFPLIIFLLHKIGINIVVAAQFINAIALLIASQGLYLLTMEVTRKRKVAILTILAWLAFPSAHFFIAFYTEAVFVALATWSLLLLLRKKYLASGILAALAGGTRGVGIIFAIVIAAQYLSDKNWSWRKIDWQIVSIPVALAGTGTYWLWLYSKTNVYPWVYFASIYDKYWPYMGFEANIFRTIYKETTGMIGLVGSTAWLDDWFSQLFTRLHFFIAWLAIAWSAWVGWRKKLPISLVVYSGLTALTLVLTGNFVSDSRYILAVFPVFILIAMWLDKQAEWVRTLYFVLSAVGLGAMLTMFSNGYWVG